MSSLDLISMAIRNLFKRKLRTFLTVLGVIIGTTAIVTMISLGIAINETFMDNLSMMGDITVVTVYNPNSDRYQYYGEMMANPGQQNKQLVLDDAAIAKFKQWPGVMVATPTAEINLKTVAGKFQSWLNIRGIDPEAMEALGYTVATGALLDADSKYGIVYGKDVPFQFYDPSAMRRRGYWSSDSSQGEPPVDLMASKVQASYDWSFGESNPNYETEIVVKPYKLNSLGILASSGYQNDYYAFMNIKEVKEIKQAQEQYEKSMQGDNTWGGTSSSRQKANKGYESAIIKCVDIDSVDAVKALVEEMGFYADTLTQYLQSMQEMSGSLQALLGAIGGVSLFVAAIGIANTMIMAIYERTREIGVMKVIGASLKDIKKLFLLEATMIGFLGGSLGVGLSLIVSRLLNTAGISFFGMITWGDQSKISVVPPWLCLVSLAFAATIGLVSGYFPARRAMKLSALSAIRTE